MAYNSMNFNSCIDLYYDHNSQHREQFHHSKELPPPSLCAHTSLLPATHPQLLSFTIFCLSDNAQRWNSTVINLNLLWDWLLSYIMPLWSMLVFTRIRSVLFNAQECSIIWMYNLLIRSPKNEDFEMVLVENVCFMIPLLVLQVSIDSLCSA